MPRNSWGWMAAIQFALLPGAGGLLLLFLAFLFLGPGAALFLAGAAFLAGLGLAAKK